MFFPIPLVFLLIENDEDRLFLEGLYMEYHQLMYVQALHVLKSEQHAQDAVSDAILALTKKYRFCAPCHATNCGPILLLQ